MAAAEKLLLDKLTSLRAEDYAKVVKFVDYLDSECDTYEMMLLAESALAKAWDCPEEDEAWANL